MDGLETTLTPAETLKDERGQSLVLITLCMTCLAGILGLAVDGGLLFRAKRITQTAADSAAIAGSAELRYGSVTAVAKAASGQNGVTDGSNGGTVTVNNPPQSGPHNGNSSYVEVIASQSVPTIFMALFNQATVTVSSRAVAGNVASHGCLYALEGSGTGILVNGSETISMPGCAIYDDSNDGTQAMLINGSGSLTANSIGVVGKVLKNGTFTIVPNPVTGIVPVPDPLAYLQAPTPPNSCGSSYLFNGSGNGTANPGCYQSFTVNGSGNVTLSPGLYIIENSLILNGSGTVSGTGVTFYLMGTSTFNGSQTLHFIAPTSGTYNGVLFFQSRLDTQSVTLNGSGSSVLEGIFYFPVAQVTFNGSSSSGLYTTVVSHSFVFNGSLTINDYATINSGTPIAGPRLIE